MFVRGKNGKEFRSFGFAQAFGRQARFAQPSALSEPARTGTAHRKPFTSRGFSFRVLAHLSRTRAASGAAFASGLTGGWRACFTGAIQPGEEEVRGVGETEFLAARLRSFAPNGARIAGDG